MGHKQHIQLEHCNVGTRSTHSKPKILNARPSVYTAHMTQLDRVLLATWMFLMYSTRATTSAGISRECLEDQRLPGIMRSKKVNGG